MSAYEEVDARHIDDARDEIDFFLGYKPLSSQTEINPAEAMVDDLIHEHHRALIFELAFNNDPPLKLQSLQALVFHILDHPKKEITQIRVTETPIPWLHSTTLKGRFLSQFLNAVEERRDTLKRRDCQLYVEECLSPLAYKYLFGKTLENVATPFAEYHSIFKLSPTQENEKPTRDWFRVTCFGEGGRQIDFILFKSSLAPPQPYAPNFKMPLSKSPKIPHGIPSTKFAQRPKPFSIKSINCSAG